MTDKGAKETADDGDQDGQVDPCVLAQRVIDALNMFRSNARKAATVPDPYMTEAKAFLRTAKRHLEDLRSALVEHEDEKVQNLLGQIIQEMEPVSDCVEQSMLPDGRITEPNPGEAAAYAAQPLTLLASLRQALDC